MFFLFCVRNAEKIENPRFFEIEITFLGFSVTFLGQSITFLG
jgi:hypothetical protein